MSRGIFALRNPRRFAMGLDGLELVMEFEEQFGIAISDEVATQMTTVGITVEKIVSMLEQQPREVGVCATARSFYRLRHELINRFGVSRHDVQLDAPIGFLVPREGERKWNAI